MIDVIDNRFFHLHNNKISYVFYVMENGQLGHLYYGQSLDNLTMTDIKYLMTQECKSAGTVKYSAEHGNFTLADRAQEYPVYGSSDFKEGAIDICKDEAPWYLDFKYSSYMIQYDKERNLKVPATYSIGEHESETLIIKLMDKDHLVELQAQYTIFEDFSVIARQQKVINHNKYSVQLSRIMSGVLDLPDANYQFLSLSGAWLKERHPKFRSLEQGVVSVSSLKGASSHQHNPFIALVRDKTLNTGEIYAANLIYSGNFISQVEVDEWDKTRLLIGINPSYFGWQLDSETSFTTPEAILYYSNEGINGLIAETNLFAEKHIIDRKWHTKERPIVFNNWEATYFNFDEQKLLALADDAKKLGMECFVVDDGWFGHRDCDRVSLGDWHVDQRKFVHGISNFANEIHKKGLQLGLWFEPEMVSPDTDLYKKHPDWVVRHPYQRVSIGRGQYVLDFSNPEVVDDIYQQMAQVIQDTDLDYLKWDMNRNITEAYSSYLKRINRPETEFFHRYIKGVYSLYNKILTNFPDLLIEGCAGGGGRYDLGILFYSPQIWPSDDSDAIERLSILTGTTLAYPLSSFSNHLSAIPNDQTGRETSLRLRESVSNFGPVGYELDITKLSEQQRKSLKRNIEYYKNNRELLTTGQFQQLLPIGSTNNTVAWCVHDAKSDEIIIGFYRKLAEANPAVLKYFKVPQVDESAVYLINNQEKVSGHVLKKYGLREPYQFNGVNPDTAQVRGDFQSWSYHLKKCN